MAPEAPAAERRVLIVAPTRRDADVTRRLFERAQIGCEICPGLASLAASMEAGVGAVVLTEQSLLDPAFGAFRTALAMQPAWSDVPTVILTRHKDLPDEARHALAGLTNVTLLDLPTSTRTLVSAVQSSLRARARQYEIRDRLVRQAAAEEALREADRRKDEFLATLAHELRNPLAAIRTGMHVVLRHPDDGAKVRQVLQMIDRQSRLLVKLIDDLLDVSRIATGKVVLHREVVDMRGVVEAAIEMARSAMEAARHDVRQELPAQPVRVWGDAARLAQVVSNLLHNAAKYTPDGGRISVSLATTDAEAVVEVTDNGLGLPDDMLPRVFDLFTQVNQTLDRSQGGLGIGLSLVRRLTELHGGSVAAASAGPNRGSTFTVRLPLARVDDHRGAPADAGASGAGESSARRLRLLVVDDNADVADALADLLRTEGHETRTAYGGAAGIAAARDFAPHIVFCDVGMPGVGGHEVAMRLRADPRHAQTLLVAVTGWGSEEHQRQTRAAGFDVHLTKPISPEALHALFRRAGAVAH